MSDSVIDRLEAALRQYVNIACTRDWLEARVFAQPLAEGSRALDVAISDVRKRLQDGERIESVPNVGYRLTAPHPAAIVASKIEASGERLIRENAAWLREMADK